jgi:hypothetical protein
VTEPVKLEDVVGEKLKGMRAWWWVIKEMERELDLPPAESECLFYSGPDGARCWQLFPNGTMKEITKTVIAEAARHEVNPMGDSMKVGDKVRLNEAATRLPVQVRARFRPGDAGVVSVICGRVYIKVEVEKKGEVRLPAIWVDKDDS